jgi:PAS domain-containing protein
MPLSDIAASDIVETAPSALIVLDQNLNITSADRAFYQTFRTSPDETEGLMARHSRVNSSINVISLSLRPSWVWASTKS